MAGRGYAIWGMQFFCLAMHFEMDKIRGGNAFAYPKKVLKTKLATSGKNWEWQKLGLRAIFLPLLCKLLFEQRISSDGREEFRAVVSDGCKEFRAVVRALFLQ